MCYTHNWDPVACLCFLVEVSSGGKWGGGGANVLLRVECLSHCSQLQHTAPVAGEGGGRGRGGCQLHSEILSCQSPANILHKGEMFSCKCRDAEMH